MNWFRSNIKHGSRLALFALAVQCVLSFGHFHPIAAQAAPAIQSAAIQSGISSTGDVPTLAAANKSTQRPLSDHDSDGPNDVCAICAVMAMANAVLFATPPVLLLPQAVEFQYRVTDPELIRLSSVRVAFQPRGPPVS
jgi:hypothetical protein